MMASVKLCALLAVGAVGGCFGQTTASGKATGGDTTGGGDPSAFVGEWTCTGTATATSDQGGPSALPFVIDETDRAIFVENPDATLTMTLETLAIRGVPEDTDGGVPPCSIYQFAISGSTATAVSGPSCHVLESTQTFKSGAFTVSGNNATITLLTDVSPDPGTTVVASTTTLSETCSRGPESDADAASEASTD